MAKLFAIFAAQAPVGVLLRRGPSDWYHVIRWDVDHDTFEHGAWIKGRIFEEACDVSPDGELLVYFIRQGSRGRTSYSEAYTAVSRVPWLKALALWPNADGHGPAWGGGRFHGRRILALRNASESHPEHPPIGLHLAAGDTSHHSSTSEVEGADWCGRDTNNRLVYSRGGKLYRREGSDDALIGDFDDLSPNPQPAPSRAGALLKTLNAEKARRPKKWRR